MNRGIASSSGEIVAFTDADCVVTTGWARELVSSFRDEQAWAVAGEVFPYPPATPAERYLATHFGSWQERQLNSYRPFALTANVAFRRATFARIGVFGTDIGVSYDKELSWRLLEQALEIHYNPAAAVFYRHRSSAWGLLRQQISWGHGAALVRAKFDLPGTISDEPRSAMKTGQSVAKLALAFLTLTPREWKGNRRHLHDAYFEVLRRTGFHVGALTGTMAALQTRASKAPDLATTHARAAIDAQMED
jgi:cellulose synthase/poly-beta-1,6-N-acetylglucosamine synthase-like glycosyltransferase